MLRSWWCLVVVLYPFLIAGQQSPTPKSVQTLDMPAKLEIDDDEAYSPNLAHRAFVTDGPVVLLDEGHGNSHFDKAFVKLMSEDGYTVKVLRGKFKYDDLSKARVLVIMNPGLFMTMQWHQNPAPLFSEVEAAAVRDWVAAGGALLFASGIPKSESRELLLNHLGIDMSDDLVIDKELDRSANPTQPGKAFTREKKMFSTHSIMTGRSELERVDVVVVDSANPVMKFPENASVLFHFSDQALIVHHDWLFKKQMAEATQELHDGKATESKPISMQSLGTPAPGVPAAMAFTLGKGRVVVLGNSSILSSVRQQYVLQGEKVDQRIGLGNGDNQKLTLNIMHWLTGLLE